MQTIEQYIPITHAKARLLDVVRRLHDTNDTVAITKNGTPAVVMLSMRKFEGLLETLDILADRETVEQLKASIADFNQDRVVPADDVFKDV